MIPAIDGEVLHFESRGLYDGVSLLWDEETESLWHHVTGEALAGPLAGEKLEVFNLLQMPAERALEAHPGLRVAISDRPIRGDGTTRSTERDIELSDRFRQTMSEEDTRRPTMEIGLGVWNDPARRYYAVSDLREAGRAVIDELGGERILVYLEPGTATPMALHTEAESARWSGDELLLDDGTVLRNGVLFDESGARRPVSRPLQLFTRWYGWALMYPETEIWTGTAQIP